MTRKDSRLHRVSGYMYVAGVCLFRVIPAVETTPPLSLPPRAGKPTPSIGISTNNHSYTYIEVSTPSRESPINL